MKYQSLSLLMATAGVLVLGIGGAYAEGGTKSGGSDGGKSASFSSNSNSSNSNDSNAEAPGNDADDGDSEEGDSNEAVENSDEDRARNISRSAASRSPGSNSFDYGDDRSEATRGPTSFDNDAGRTGADFSNDDERDYNATGVGSESVNSGENNNISGTANTGVTFGASDTDGNGYVSEQEFRNSLDSDFSQDSFNEFDANGDGTLNSTEYDAYFSTSTRNNAER